MWTMIVGFATVGVLWWLGRSWLDGWKQVGRDEEAADEARRDREVARKQGEVMTQHKDAKDVADDLERGEF